MNETKKNNGDVQENTNHEAQETISDSASSESHTLPSDFFEHMARLRAALESAEDGDDTKEEDDSDDDAYSEMDADDFHNKSVAYARSGHCSKAVSLCQVGLKRFPLNVDLVADIIKYASDIGNNDVAERYFAVLRSVPVSRWNWRAFDFTLDYLMKADPYGNEETCRTIIANFRKYIPWDERADVSESELEEKLGHHDASLHVLENAVQTHSNACQCALLLADAKFDRGDYEGVLQATSYGITASVQVQPAINVPYLLLLRILANDHILHAKEGKDGAVKKEEVDALQADYTLFCDEFPEYVRRREDTIRTRMKLLKFIKIL